MSMETSPNVQTLLDAQLAYTLNGGAEREGSLAISYGRSAGLAVQLGFPQLAQALWNRVPQHAGTPGFEQFVQNYQAHAQHFAEFADATKFPAAGTALSNALGSYAYALDYQARGADALCGGEARYNVAWGNAALQAAALQPMFAVQVPVTAIVTGQQQGGTIVGNGTTPTR